MKKISFLILMFLAFSCQKKSDDPKPDQQFPEKIMTVKIISGSPDGFDMFYRAEDGTIIQHNDVDSIWQHERDAYVGMILHYEAKNKSRASIEIRGEIDGEMIFKRSSINSDEWFVKHDTVTYLP